MYGICQPSCFRTPKIVQVAYVGRSSLDICTWLLQNFTEYIKFVHRFGTTLLEDMYTLLFQNSAGVASRGGSLQLDSAGKIHLASAELLRVDIVGSLLRQSFAEYMYMALLEVF